MSWDDDNFEPPVLGTIPVKKPVYEEAEVPESWDAVVEEEEEKPKSKPETKPVVAPAAKAAPKPKVKGPQAKQAQANTPPPDPEAGLDPAELKRLRQAAVEKADFENTKDLFRGIGGDSYVPTEESQYIELADIISERVAQFKSSFHYIAFLKELVRKLGAGLKPEELKEVSTTVSAMYNEALKAEKKKSGKKTTAPKKPVAKVDKGWIEDDIVDDEFSAYT